MKQIQNTKVHIKRCLKSSKNFTCEVISRRLDCHSVSISLLFGFNNVGFLLIIFAGLILKIIFQSILVSKMWSKINKIAEIWRNNIYGSEGGKEVLFYNVGDSSSSDDEGCFRPIRSWILSFSDFLNFGWVSWKLFTKKFIEKVHKIVHWKGS